MDAFALADKPPVSTLSEAPMGEPRIPCHWNSNRATVDEINGERIFGYRYALCPRRGQVTLKR